MSERPFRFRSPSAGGRLDLVVSGHLPEVSRNQLQECIRRGLVLVDEVPVTRPGHRLKGGEWVRGVLPAPVPSVLVPESIPLDVLFENADVLVVNKPAGMVVHPAAGHPSGTLVHAALAHAPDLQGIGGEIRPGVVHRLDRETSGVIVLAKHVAALQHLQAQFRDRATGKMYLALVDGAPPTPTGKVEAAIGRDPRHRQRMAIRPSGRSREAVTTYRVLESFPAHTLVEAEPKTGRTHQVRVHLAFLGCPVVGDRVYGHRRPTLPVSRHMLHAWRLELVLPGETQRRTFEASVPSEFVQVLDALRG